MSAGTYLQLAGAAFEIGGLVTVAWGIAETRQAFTDRPSLARRTWTRMERAAARFRRRRPQEVSAGTIGMTLGAVTMKARGRVGLGPWDDVEVEERIERLRLAIENHETTLDRLDDRIDAEEKSRTEADERHERRVTEVQQELNRTIREAAAGGLRLETIGVVLFGLGVVLGTWGNLLD